MKKIEIEDMYDFNSISDMITSPSGKYFAYLLVNGNRDNKYEKKACICQVITGDLLELEIKFEIKNILWLHDDSLLIIGVDEVSAIYNIGKNICEYNNSKVTNINYYAKEIEEGLFICTSNEFIEKTVYDSYKIIDELPFVENALGFTCKQRKKLFLFNSDTDESVDVSEKYFHLSGFDVDKSKNNIVFWGQNYKNIRRYISELFIYDISLNKKKEIVFEEEMFIEYANYITENEIVIVASNMKKFGENQEPTFYVYDLKESKFRIIADPNLNLWNSIATDCKTGSSKQFSIYDKELYFLTSKNYSVDLYKINLHGEIKKVSKLEGSVDGYHISDDGMYICGLRKQNLQEIYKIRGKEEVQISSHNISFTYKNKAVPEKIQFSSKNDREIDGWIMKPANFDESKKYPTILNIHGGPKMMYGEVYNHELQLQVAEGYVVIYCNPIGSNGKGNEFSDIRGKFGKDDYNDIMGFLTFVCERYGYIDKDRLGLMGGSYGGFMTNWILGHTDMFKVAVSQRSISNWITMYGVSDIGYHWTKYQTKATPWDEFENLWEQSPLKYANQVKTPTLFIHSKCDYRCPIVEGLQMFSILKMQGVDTKLLMFEDENHLLAKSGKMLNRVVRLREIFKWIKTYI